MVFFQDQTPKKYLKRDGQQFNKNGILNESYSHFILIDDGTENKFGGEIDFRTNLEKFISEQSVNPVNPDDKESCKLVLCTCWTTNLLFIFMLYIGIFL